MSTNLLDPLTALQQPEYTGENRCIPCTVANTVIAAVAAAIVWILLTPLVAAFVFVVSLAAIYLRGYLIPGTPELTKRYFPDRLLAVFDTYEDPEPVDLADFDIERWLVEAGIVAPCSDRDDLCLSEDFRWEWHEEIHRVRDQDLSRGILSDVLDIPESDIRFESFGDAYAMFVGTQRIGTWESEAAFYADVAGAEIIPQWSDDWEALSPDARSSLLASLRLFLETCPACGGAVMLDEDVVESCCRSIDVYAVTCTECDSRLFEVKQPEGAEAAAVG